MGLTTWQNWCRLCAKIPPIEDDDFQHLVESTKELIQRCFPLVNSVAIFMTVLFLISAFFQDLEPFESIPAKLCPSCVSFLDQLKSFDDICGRSQKLFDKIISSKKQQTEDDDVFAIRSLFFSPEDNLPLVS